MKKVFLKVALLILSISLITGCGGGANSIFEDSKWFLSSYGEQGNLKALIDGTEITATFDSSKVELTGSAGCNTYFARYEVDGSELFILEMASTEMACLSPAGVMQQEQEFLSIITSTQSFEADATTLTIFCSGGLQLNFTTATR